MKLKLPEYIRYNMTWDKARYHPAIVPTNVSTVYQSDIRDQIFCGDFCGDVLPLSAAVKEEDSGRLWSFSFTINATALSDPSQVRIHCVSEIELVPFEYEILQVV